MSAHAVLRTVVLAEYWRAAASPVPLVVAGGGRWGRVWVQVIGEARGSAEGIIIMARSDPGSVREWLRQQPRLRGATIVSSLHDAMQISPAPAAAIIASRPADHGRDATEALERGLHILVEKPIAPQSGESWKLVAAAARAGRTLAVGTEFALLPAFHSAAAALGKRLREPLRLTLHWHDPVHEVRHGQTKAHHAETSLLADLLPHAFSIFQIFAPSLHVSAASLAPDGRSGALVLADASGGHYELLCDTSAAGRMRRLEISSGAVRATIDFAEHPPRIEINGKDHPLDPQLANMSSTLRLELGAFLMDITGAAVGTPITAHVPDLIRLHTELESIVIVGGHH